MKAETTVKENYEFRRIYRKGKSSVKPALVVYCQKNRQGKSRLGVTVNKKMGHAVVRNHVKRQLREIYRHHKDELISGYDLILVSRMRIVNIPFRKIEKQYLAALDELELRNIQGEEK